MAYSRPTLSGLIESVKADFQARLLSGTKPLRRSVVSILSKVIAGGLHHVYGYAAWVFKQIFPDTADLENLKRWSKIWGIFQKAATKAEGPYIFTGTNGVDVPAGTVAQRSDGAQFETLSLVTIAAGVATATIQAIVAGTDGNTDDGVTMNLVSPIAGINTAGTVDAAGIADGTDIETRAELLDRLLQRLQNPPLSGTAADYERWALEVDGVTRAWVYENYLGIGNVGVTFVLDNASPIIPPAGKVTEVQDYLDAKKPIPAIVNAFAPVEVVQGFSIEITPDTAAIRAAVEAELIDFMRRESEPGATLYISQINEAISIAAGEVDHILHAPVVNVVYAQNEIGTFGTITWV